MKTLLASICCLVITAGCSSGEMTLGTGSDGLTTVACTTCDLATYPPIPCPQGAKVGCFVKTDGTCGWDNKCPGGPPVIMTDAGSAQVDAGTCSTKPIDCHLCPAPQKTVVANDDKGCPVGCKCVPEPTCADGVPAACAQNALGGPASCCGAGYTHCPSDGRCYKDGTQGCCPGNSADAGVGHACPNGQIYCDSTGKCNDPTCTNCCPCPAPPSCPACPPGTKNVSVTNTQGCAIGCKCEPAQCTDPECGPAPLVKSCLQCGDGCASPVCNRGTDGKCGWGFQCTTWYVTCGDPVCRVPGAGAPPAPSAVRPCTSAEKAGAACKDEGVVCDAGLGCGALLVCAKKDPKLNGCPISRREYKRDIKYLGTDELSRYRDELLGMKLATWRYKEDPARERLGFIIDDLGDAASVAVASTGEKVDLYGYTSLAVAALQLQARQIEALEHEVASLRGALKDTHRKHPRR